MSQSPTYEVLIDGKYVPCLRGASFVSGNRLIYRLADDTVGWADTGWRLDSRPRKREEFQYEVLIDGEYMLCTWDCHIDDKIGFTLLDGREGQAYQIELRPKKPYEAPTVSKPYKAPTGLWSQIFPPNDFSTESTRRSARNWQWGLIIFPFFILPVLLVLWATINRNPGGLLPPDPQRWKYVGTREEKVNWGHSDDSISVPMYVPRAPR